MRKEIINIHTGGNNDLNMIGSILDIKFSSRNLCLGRSSVLINKTVKECASFSDGTIPIKAVNLKLTMNWVIKH